MLIIGLTGGIGSGKSTVAQLFSALSVPIIDADLISRQVTLNPATMHEISRYFGASILKKDGTLDRNKLKTLIFNDPVKKTWLEKLLHPLIIQEIKKQLNALKASYCIVIIPLLVETGPYSFIDRILVVDTPEEKCLERAQIRDNINQATLQKIMNSQVSRDKRLAAADDIIHNQGELSELQQGVKDLHQYYLTLLD